VPPGTPADELVDGVTLDDGVALDDGVGVPTPAGLDVFVIVFESSVIAPFVLMT
jgi:hypothetical protein